jgi:TPR repeat protein
MWSCVLFAYAVAMATIFAGVAALDPAGSRLTEEEMTLLLRRARESRHGRQSQQTNLGKAKAFYKKVIEGGDGKLQGEAMFELSEMIESEPGFMTSQSSKTVSIDLLMRAAEAGHPAAQHSLSIAYATGLHNGIVPMDAGRALILEYMAALGGDPEANMGMGYRYMKGIGVQENCLSAVAHYEYAANAAVNQISERGYAYHIEHSKLSDIEKATVKGKREFDREIIDYYTNLANEGDWQAATSLSNIYIHGSRLVDQNLGKATKFLEMAVRGGSPTAAGLLGYLMLTRGDHKNGTTILEAKRLIQGAANRGITHIHFNMHI